MNNKPACAYVCVRLCLRPLMFASTYVSVGLCFRPLMFASAYVSVRFRAVQRALRYTLIDHQLLRLLTELFLYLEVRSHGCVFSYSSTFRYIQLSELASRESGVKHWKNPTFLLNNLSKVRPIDTVLPFHTICRSKIACLSTSATYMLCCLCNIFTFVSVFAHVVRTPCAVCIINHVMYRMHVCQCIRAAV